MSLVPSEDVSVPVLYQVGDDMFYLTVPDEEIEELRGEAALLRSVASDSGATRKEIEMMKIIIRLRSQMIDLRGSQSAVALASEFCKGGPH